MDITAYQHMNIRMSTRGKRPLRNLTPSDKVRAIQRIHNGETKASVSRDIGVPESTLRGWCKNEQKLRFMCRQLGASADQISLVGLHGGGGENPPEKRSKFDGHVAPKFPQLAIFDEFPYNRLPLTGMDFALNGVGGGGGSTAGSGLHHHSNNNNNNININNNNTSSNNNNNNNTTGITGNAILDKIAFNEFLKNSSLQNSDERKAYGNTGGVNLHLQSMMSSLPIPTALTGTDYSQHLSMMQNLNLLTLLNPSLAAMSAGATSTANAIKSDEAKVKIPLRTSRTKSPDGGAAAGDQAKDSSKTDSPVLSVKNWAKDPSENSSPSKNSNCSSSSGSNKSRNDTNNNDLKAAKSSFTPLAVPDVLPLFPLPQIPTADLLAINPDGEGSTDGNAALLEWCKVFNASLNFLALAAAAASLQSPAQQQSASASSSTGTAAAANSTIITTAVDTPTSSDDNASKSPDSPDRTADSNNILYKQLTKTAAAAAAVAAAAAAARSSATSFHSPDNAHLLSDASNDSYYDSEPEDLSVRSTTSKLSTPTNSRSQSPTKSTISSDSSVHSDAEQ